MAISICISLIVLTLILNFSQIQGNNCLDSRTEALTREKDEFIPECTRDGLFASVQCHRSSGYCWCVDVMTGRPKSQTTTRNRSPNCNNSGRRSTNRDPNRKKGKRFCNSSQRVLFNTQLLSVFVSENSRKSGQHNNESSISASIDNKFTELDANYDQRITRQESRDLILLIKKLFPLFRVCAQQMFTFCDLNNDSFVTKNEFKECLNFDFSFRAFLSLNSTSSSGSSEESSGLTSSGGPKRTGFQNPFELNARNDNENKKESRLDCYITRSNALESLKVNPSGQLFIPECTKDGYYVRIQCHKSYCWCVSRVSGQPIKTLENMSSNTENNCLQMRKGCDQRRRNKFHLRFRQILEKDNSSCDSIYHKIDSNSNFFVENNEWKEFRQIWRKSQTFNSRLRKCFRTEINYCDQNYDRKLSKQEWLLCCQSTGGGANAGRDVRPLDSSSGGISFQNGLKRHKKLGPNPLETILKSE